jgi:hypothetical protein
MGSFEPGDEPNRCTAKSKQSGNRCTKPVVVGRAVCRYHGGLGGRPIKHGRYSKALGSLREAYEDARNDPTLLELRDTLAVLDVIVQKCAARVGELDTPQFREKALILYEEAQGSTDPLELRAKLRDLGGILRSGVEEDEALGRLSDAVEKMARRQEKAWDLRLSAANAINARDMVALLGRFADIILDEADDETATRIIGRIDREVMGEGKTADRLASGGDPLGPTVRHLPEPADGLHGGGAGVEAVEEAE